MKKTAAVLLWLAIGSCLSLPAAAEEAVASESEVTAVEDIQTDETETILPETEEEGEMFQAENEALFGDESMILPGAPDKTESGNTEFSEGETEVSGFMDEGAMNAEQQEMTADSVTAGTELFSGSDTDTGELPEPGAVEATLNVREGEDITAPLNELLFIMGQRATDEQPCKVTIPPGSYQLTGTICMYSNLHLCAQGATITKTSREKHILLRLGNSEISAGGYDGYRNITIEGGTWDCNYAVIEDKAGGTGYVGFRIGHASHVTVKNVTFLNNLKSHFLELAGVRDVLVTGCTFRGYWEGYEGGGQECIQLDACLDYIFPNYQPFDGAVCEDVVITGNTFENVFAGVGSHSMVFDHSYRNITISGNSFYNIKKRAVWCLNYEDSRVENNVMENVGGGVLVSSVYYPNTHVLAGQNPSNKGNQQAMNVTVTGNTISISNTAVINGASWKGYGIQIEGEKAKKTSGSVPEGIYPAKSVAVTGNTITGYGNGIRLFLADNCQVTGNRVSLKKTGNFSNIGICLGASNVNTISGNAVENSRNVGIYVYNGGSSYKIAAKKNSISRNSVSGTDGDGILVEEGSTTTVVYRNTVTGSKKNGIVISGSKNCVITYNNVSKCTLDGISAVKASGIDLRANSISANKGRGMSLQSLTVSILRKNTMKENGKYGIYTEAAKVKSQKSNKMESNKSSYAICAKSSKGISSFRMVPSSTVTRKTTKLTGKIAGGKTVTVYAKKSSGNLKLARGKVTAKGRYSLSVKKQKKGTTLIFAVKDAYGNTAIIQKTVK